jgi:multidrug transporter EmrE-like cation transporter
MMLKIVLFALFPILLSAQSYHFSQGARAASMGGCGVVLQESAAIFNNSAGLTTLQSLVVAATIHNSFFLSELKAASIGVAYPVKHGVLAAQFYSYGFNSYNEQLYLLTYARKLSSSISISADAGYFRLNVLEDASRHTLATKVSAMLQLLSDVRLGVQVENPFSIVSTDNIFLPMIARVGVAYQPSKVVLLSVAFEKSNNFPISTKIGLEYFMKDTFAARIGIQTNANMPSFSLGIGYNIWKNTNLNGGLVQHAVLGGTSAVDINWNLDAKK